MIFAVYSHGKVRMRPHLGVQIHSMAVCCWIKPTPCCCFYVLLLVAFNSGCLGFVLSHFSFMAPSI